MLRPFAVWYIPLQHWATISSLYLLSTSHWRLELHTVRFDARLQVLNAHCEFYLAVYASTALCNMTEGLSGSKGSLTLHSTT